MTDGSFVRSVVLLLITAPRNINAQSTPVSESISSGTVVFVVLFVVLLLLIGIVISFFTHHKCWNRCTGNARVDPLEMALAEATVDADIRVIDADNFGWREIENIDKIRAACTTRFYSDAADGRGNIAGSGQSIPLWQQRRVLEEVLGNLDNKTTTSVLERLALDTSTASIVEAEIAALPTGSGVENVSSNEKGCEACAVCLEIFTRRSIVSVLPCRHQFHVPCIDPWLAKHGTCPLCKRHVIDSDVSGAHDTDDERRSPIAVLDDTQPPISITAETSIPSDLRQELGMSSSPSHQQRMAARREHDMSGPSSRQYRRERGRGGSLTITGRTRLHGRTSAGVVMSTGNRPIRGRGRSI